MTFYNFFVLLQCDLDCGSAAVYEYRIQVSFTTIENVAIVVLFQSGRPKIYIIFFFFFVSHIFCNGVSYIMYLYILYGIYSIESKRSAIAHLLD